MLIGDNQPPVTGVAPTFDNSAAGQALQKLYAPCVATVMRQWGWDAARALVILTVTTNVPPIGWAYEYLYPANGIEVWQLVAPTQADPNNPLPINWNTGNNLVSGKMVKVLWTNLQNAQAIYNNNPSENTWDPGLREAIVRLLASELAMAIAGRPDTAQAFLESGSAFEGIAEGRPD